MDILNMIDKQNDYVQQCRHWLHSHAELAWREFETTDFIIQQLTEMGIEAHRYPEHTGCWAMIKGGNCSENAKTILLRADIDAMPGNDVKKVPYASKNPGAVHSCGHDAHTAMLLAATKVFKEIAPELTGNVKLVFEAAEEIGTGGKYYVEQGIMNDVDAVFGIHMWNDLNSPYIDLAPGLRLSSFNIFTIRIHGKADATIFPHLAGDAALAGAKIADALQLLETHKRDPLKPTVIAIGKMHGGMAANTYCDEMELVGTVRTFSEEFHSHIDELFADIVNPIAKIMGCTADIDISKGAPMMAHDNQMMLQVSQNAASTLFGESVLKQTPLTLASDTFAYYADRAPGTFAFLGCRDEGKGFTYPLHNDNFDFDESLLPKGASLFVQVALEFFDS